MKQLDELLDKKPTRRAVVDMAELRIRNLLAFSELQTYNDTGMLSEQFLYRRRNSKGSDARKRSKIKNTFVGFVTEKPYLNQFSKNQSRLWKS